MAVPETRVVSVVIATRNGAAHISEQLEALATQELDGHVEVIVADNGSTDDTNQIASRYSEILDLRIVDASAHPGVAFARNTGVAAARGQRIVFVDDDDVVAPGYLAAMVAALGKFDFAAARVDGRCLNPAWRRKMRSVDVLEGLRLGGGIPWALGGALGVTRQAFDTVGGFDSRLTGAGEDVDLCRRMHAAGIVLRLVPDAVLRRRLRTSRRALFDQARRYAIGERDLPEDDRASPPMLSGLLGGARLAVFATNRSRRALGIYLLGRVVGRIEGSLRRRPRSSRHGIAEDGAHTEVGEASRSPGDGPR